MKSVQIERMIERSARAYGCMLGRFYPGPEDCWPAERNITFQLAHTFLAQRPNGFAFMEVRVKGSEHLDCYLFDDQLGLVVEAKRFLSVKESRLMGKDAGRIEKFAGCLDKLHRKQDPSLRPPHIYGLIIAENWSKQHKRQHHLHYWDKKRDFLAKFTTGEQKVYKEDVWTLHWLYAYRKLR